ncbi:hypothetical protein KM043_004552, partial [Ampulex compressa]
EDAGVDSLEGWLRGELEEFEARDLGIFCRPMRAQGALGFLAEVPRARHRLGPFSMAARSSTEVFRFPTWKSAAPAGGTRGRAHNAGAL